jgi:hypothetical protein
MYADVLPERVERIVPWPEQQRASHPGDRSRPIDTQGSGAFRLVWHLA